MERQSLSTGVGLKTRGGRGAGRGGSTADVAIVRAGGAVWACSVVKLGDRVVFCCAACVGSSEDCTTASDDMFPRGSSVGRSPGSPIYMCYFVGSTYRSACSRRGVGASEARAAVWPRGPSASYSLPRPVPVQTRFGRRSSFANLSTSLAAHRNIYGCRNPPFAIVYSSHF